MFFFDAVLGTAVALVFFAVESRRWRISAARSAFFVLTALLIGTDFALPLFLLQLTKLGELFDAFAILLVNLTTPASLDAFFFACYLFVDFRTRSCGQAIAVCV